MALPDRARFDVNKRPTLTAVSSADGETPVTAWADPSTHQLLVSTSGGSIRTQLASQVTTLTTTTETDIITAGTVGVYNDVYGILLSNTSATATEVVIRDQTATGVAYSMYVPASDTRGFMLPYNSAIKQTNSALSWTATCSVGVTSLKVTALYVKNT